LGLTGGTAQGLVPPPEELPAPDEEDDPELEPEPEEDEELDLPPDEPDELDPGRGPPELDEPDAPELEEVPELELVELEVEPEELEPDEPELDVGGTPLELAESDPAPELEPPPESSAGEPKPTVSLEAEHPAATSTAPNAPKALVRMTRSTSDPTSTDAESQTLSPLATAHKTGSAVFSRRTLAVSNDGEPLKVGSPSRGKTRDHRTNP
jgi:hypothetical protein